MQRIVPIPCLFFFLLMTCFQQAACAQAVPQRPRLVGYFGQWSLYNDPPYTLKDVAASHGAAMLDQLNYAQAFVTGGHCSIADRNADLDHTFTAMDSVNGQADDANSPFRGHLHQLAELKHAYPHLNAVISLEGRAADFAFDAQPEHRSAFVASCVDLFLKGNLAPNISVPLLFDGIDVDWEYPGEADAANFIALLTEMRHQMDLVRPGLILSVAVGPSPRMYQGTDFAAIASLVDQVGLMTYDFAGPWMQNTGFIAPLYAVSPPAEPLGPVPAQPTQTGAPVGGNPTASTTSAAQTAKPGGSLASGTLTPRPPPSGGASASVQAFLAAGVPAAKLLVGVPFYGYGWTQVPDVAGGVFQEGTPVRGDQPYSYIQSLVAASRLYRDPVSLTPWIFDGDAFWTFDDPISVQAKATYVLDHSLGGLMIWELSEDTRQATLLTAAHDVLTQPARSVTVPSSK